MNGVVENDFLHFQSSDGYIVQGEKIYNLFVTHFFGTFTYEKSLKSVKFGSLIQKIRRWTFLIDSRINILYSKST